MAKNKKILITSIICLSLVVFTIYPAISGAQVIGQQPAATPGYGLVPCGGPDDPCTLCHFIIGFQNLVNYGLWIVIAAAFVALFFAGVMYVISSGDESMITKAKGFLKSSLIGFLVVAGAWMIVNTAIRVITQTETGEIKLGVTSVNWYKFTCDTTSSGL